MVAISTPVGAIPHKFSNLDMAPGSLGGEDMAKAEPNVVKHNELFLF